MSLKRRTVVNSIIAEGTVVRSGATVGHEEITGKDILPLSAISKCRRRYESWRKLI